jgi:hypothetical protein
MEVLRSIVILARYGQIYRCFAAAQIRVIDPGPCAPPRYVARGA